MPALRSISAEAVQVRPEDSEIAGEDEMVVVLQDPEGFAEQPAVLSPAAYALAQLFDGDRDAGEIAEVFEAMYSQEVAVEEIHRLAAELDEALFLASSSFEDSVRQAILGYLKAKVRPCAHGGQAYPEDPDALRETIEGFFTAPGGPGALPPARPATEHRVHGMILPHIDLRVGGATYAHGYKELLEGTQADLFAILGVAHKVSGDGLFNVSSKDFATPLGQVGTERKIAKRLQKVAGIDPALAEYAHKAEHSVEFHALLLSALLGERAGRDFEILPMLCGPVEPFIESEQNPVQDDDFRRFVEALGEELDKSGRKWCVLASVDLSHVGPKFGHSTTMTKRLLLPVERSDRRMLSKIESLDTDAFYFEIARSKNSRNVDAVMAVLATLALGKGLFKGGKLLHYDQMLEPPTKSAVTFASLAFT